MIYGRAACGLKIAGERPVGVSGGQANIGEGGRPVVEESQKGILYLLASVSGSGPARRIGAIG
jgi:hypothetical protein